MRASGGSARAVIPASGFRADARRVAVSIKTIDRSRWLPVPAMGAGIETSRVPCLALFRASLLRLQIAWRVSRGDTARFLERFVSKRRR